MSETVNRSGRPHVTQDEADALEYIGRLPQGRVFLSRLERIKSHHQELDLELDGDESAKRKGRVQELKDLLREFEDAKSKGRENRPDRQARFG